MLAYNSITCTICSQDQSGSCCPGGLLAVLKFDGLPVPGTNVGKGKKKNIRKLEKPGIISNGSAFFFFFFFSNLGQVGSLAFFSMVLAWLELFWLNCKQWKAATREPIILSKVAWFHLFFIGGTARRGHVSLYHTISALHPWCHLSLDWYHRAAAPPSPGQDLVLNCSQLGAGAHFSIRNSMMPCMR